MRNVGGMFLFIIAIPILIVGLILWQIKAIIENIKINKLCASEGLKRLKSFKK